MKYARSQLRAEILAAGVALLLAGHPAVGARVSLPPYPAASYSRPGTGVIRDPRPLDTSSSSEAMLAGGVPVICGNPTLGFRGRLRASDLLIAFDRACEPRPAKETEVELPARVVVEYQPAFLRRLAELSKRDNPEIGRMLTLLADVWKYTAFAFPRLSAQAEGVYFRLAAAFSTPTALGLGALTFGAGLGVVLFRRRRRRMRRRNTRWVRKSRRKYRQDSRPKSIIRTWMGS